MSYRMSVASGIWALILLFASGQALAQHAHDGSHQMGSGHAESEAGHSHEMAVVHGGQVIMTPQHHFEVLFTDDQSRVYVYDGKQNPITNPKDVTATMTLMMKDGKSETMNLDYTAPDPEKGRTQGYFYVDRDMTGVKDGEMKAVIKMAGLQKDPIEFRTAVTMGHLVSYACPMGDSDPAEDPGKCPGCGMQMKMTEHGEHMGEAMGEHMEHGHGDTEGSHDH